MNLRCLGAGSNPQRREGADERQPDPFIEPPRSETIAARADGRRSNDARAPGLRTIRSWVAAAVLVSTAALPQRALACGASAGGAAGVSACSLEDHLEAVRSKWRLGASYAFTSTALRFNGESRFDESRHVAFATIAYRFTPAWAFEATLGSILGGRLDSGSSRNEFNPGLLAAIGMSYRILEGRDARPFAALTGQVASVVTSTRSSDAPGSSSTGYEALDVRAGIVAGWTLWETTTPYAFARVFGGPVAWRNAGATQTGTDVHHFQLGAGLLARLGRQVDVFVEGVPLGELGISGGAAFTF